MMQRSNPHCMLRCTREALLGLSPPLLQLREEAAAPAAVGTAAPTARWAPLLVCSVRNQEDHSPKQSSHRADQPLRASPPRAPQADVEVSRVMSRIVLHSVLEHEGL